MQFYKTTEQYSLYKHLEQMSVSELRSNVNSEEKPVEIVFEQAMPQIDTLVTPIFPKLNYGGRLFYIGAGISDSLGTLDISESPLTLGVSHDLVVGLIAGGDDAIGNAVEFAEGSTQQGWINLQNYDLYPNEVIVGIAASGTTPYIMSSLEICNQNDIITGSIYCNQNSPLSRTAQFPIEVIVCPEYVTGSSRMKIGRAQNRC